MVTFSCIAYAVRTASNSTPNPIKLSHAQQLVAASFGYNSLAALQASNYESEAYDEAKHFVLDTALLSSRAQELKLPHALDELELLIQSAINERIASARFYSPEMMLDEFVRSKLEHFVLNHDETSGAMAMTNNDGIDEIYLPFDELVMSELPLPGESLALEFDGHISMVPDTERPYSGHHIDVTGRVILERVGRVCIAEPIFEVNAKLDFGWGDEDIPPKVPLSQALAEELGIELSEAEELVDAEPLAVESNDDLVYRYTYDFSLFASPAVAKKLIAKHGSLQIDVPPWFFDRVRH